MEMTYEEALKYDIDGAIKILGKHKKSSTSIEDILKESDNDPARIPNNPLLTDFNWVYENVEKIYCRNILMYQQNQGFEQYYTLFMALITKYSVEEDYLKCLNGKSTFSALRIKWGVFAANLLNFMNCAFDERLEKLLDQPQVLSYLFRYPELYSPESLGGLAHGKLLKYPNISDYYVSEPHRMARLINRYFRLKIPQDIILDKRLIKNTARTHHIEQFYYELSYIGEQTLLEPYLDEHQRFCDEQVSGIQECILPCYLDSYRKSARQIYIDDIPRNFNAMERQVIERIFKRYNLQNMPSKFMYQQLSKYMLIGMFISRNYRTDPYNLLIDIETLYKFAVTHNRKVQGLGVYKVLITFEGKTIGELIDFYNRFKDVPLMEILYDDWNKLKYEFIDELNASIFSLDGMMPTKDDKGRIYYDVSDMEKPMIVHNTGVPIEHQKELDNLIEIVQNGYKDVISLSVQDDEHSDFYIEDSVRHKRTIKFVYGPLTHNRVGIIWHSDAYSQGASQVEIENTYYKREFYTLDELMKRTQSFNEIVYVINGEAFMPIGVLCENWIDDVECNVAEVLNIPLIYRKTKESSIKASRVKPLQKRYTHMLEKKLFEK